MNNIIYKICLLFIFPFMGNSLAAQCACDIDVMMIQDPIDVCCFDLKLCNAGGVNCAGLNFNTITVISNPNLTFTSNIIQAFPGNLNVSPNIVNPFTATFVSSIPFNSITSSCSSNNDYFSIGSICIDNAAMSISSFQIDISTNNSPPISCTTNVYDFPTAACQGAPCFVDFSYTSDCLDVQFTNLSTGTAPLSYSWDFDNDTNPDATSANPTHTYPAYGTYTACLTVTDGTGALCGVICHPITLSDTIPPHIICSQDVTVNAVGCSAGEVAFFHSPTFGDNCPGVTYSCDHMSGDFFPCGQTIVTCTAMDLAGNTDQCTFTVNVQGCDGCPEMISNYSVECFDRANGVYFFSINLSGITNSLVGSPSASSPSGALFNTNWAYSTLGATGIFDGYITCPSPSASFVVNLIFTFNCPNGQQISCPISVLMDKPCCHEISLADQSVCALDQTANIPLIGCSNLPGLQQVTWYVSPLPCGSAPIIYQVSSNCSDLLLLPDKLTGDVCVYAVVDYIFGSNNCTLTTNTAIISLCQPVGCTLSNASQEFCSFGAPVPVLPLTITPSDTNWVYTVQWCDGNGNPIPGATNNTYNPGSLAHISGSNNDCFTTYQYTAKITNICGTQSCSASITIYNDNAPDGQLNIVYPVAPVLPPYCPGQDATIQYVPECVGPIPYKWDWFMSTTSSSTGWSYLGTAGTINTLFNTNKNFVDTWYKVEKQNGVCPIDSIIQFIDILTVASIQYFHAIPDDPCNPMGIQLDLGFTTDCPSGVTVYWYKDGTLIHTSTHLPPTASYFHFDPLNYPGNYYIVMEDNCCQGRTKSFVHTIEPACFADVAGPCFRCNDETVTLQGFVFNLPPGANCTYQWYQDQGGIWVPISGATSDLLSVNDSGCFRFEALCNGCLKQADFCIKQCGDPLACSCPHLLTDVAMGFTSTVVASGLYEFQPMAPLLDCNEISWEWGDGTPNEYTTGSSTVLHSFSNGGSTNICMNVTRVQEDGSNCNETYCELITNLPLIFEGTTIRLFPNPAVDEFTLQFEEVTPKAGYLEIIDLYGRTIETHILINGQKEHVLSIGSLPPGGYFIKVMEKDITVWLEKIILL